MADIEKGTATTQNEIGTLTDWEGQTATFASTFGDDTTKQYA